MRITEELRKWAREHQVLVGGLGLEAVADRIDERWTQEESDFDLMSDKIAAQARCLVEVGEALGVSADQPDSEFYWELAEAARGCIQLPKDAEGVPFRVGDHVEVPDGPPDAGRPNVRGMIVALKLGVVTWHIHVKLPSGNTTRHLVENVHHVHVPTVEDVLREMVAAYMDTPLDDSNNGEFFAEYAAKLRLAGDAE